MKNEGRLTAKAVIYASIAFQLYLTRDADALREHEKVGGGWGEVI
jgi:hypothetical protein